MRVRRVQSSMEVGLVLTLCTCVVGKEGVNAKQQELARLDAMAIRVDGWDGFLMPGLVQPFRISPRRSSVCIRLSLSVSVCLYMCPPGQVTNQRGQQASICHHPAG